MKRFYYLIVLLIGLTLVQSCDDECTQEVLAAPSNSAKSSAAKTSGVITVPIADFVCTNGQEYTIIHWSEALQDYTREDKTSCGALSGHVGHADFIEYDTTLSINQIKSGVFEVPCSLQIGDTFEYDGVTYRVQAPAP